MDIRIIQVNNGFLVTDEKQTVAHQYRDPTIGTFVAINVDGLVSIVRRMGFEALNQVDPRKGTRERDKENEQYSDDRSSV